MKKYGYIYQIIIQNKHSYVGQHKWPHKGLDPHYFGSGTIVRCWLKKHSVDELNIKLLQDVSSAEEAATAEVAWINKLKPDWNLVSTKSNTQSRFQTSFREKNRQQLLIAGEIGRSCPEVQERRIRNTRQACRTESFRNKMSEINKGRKTWNYGLKDCYSKAYIDKKSAIAKRNGLSKIGLHSRWHVNRGIVLKNCALCIKGEC